MFLQSDKKMPFITDEGRNILVCFDESEKQMEEGIVKYEYEAVRIKKPYTYSDAVSSLIRDHYDDDSMQAIINNHLAGYEEHEAEFNEMQAWRLKSKEVAKMILSDDSIKNVL